MTSMLSRAGIVFLHDVLMGALAWTIAFWLRFNLDIPNEYTRIAMSSLPIVMTLQAMVCYSFGLYRGMWRFASILDLWRIIIASLTTAAVVSGVISLLSTYHHSITVPRSVLVLYPLLLVVALGGTRFVYRGWKDGVLSRASETGLKPVVILGAGSAAALLVRELLRGNEWRVVGLVDDDQSLHGRQIHGIPVLGSIVKLAELPSSMAVRHAIMAMPSASAAQRRRATEHAASAGLTVLTVPTLADILAGRIDVTQVRRVELEDLLGREAVQLDEGGLHRFLGGKVVLVTGAGGSIGSELCRQIIRFGPRVLVLYEVAEFALYTIDQELISGAIRCEVGDVKDRYRLQQVFELHRPDVVFHAAAYKHVPLMEQANAWEAVRNNVAGTWNVARAAIENGASEFVLVSTDKAVNPTNVMGATKRLAERVCQALQRRTNSCTLVSVRFGNVLGSSGSVIPKFRAQIGRGGPVTVTHPDIVRYFMLIPEAAQLVLQAALQANRDDTGGEIFVLDMGEPVRIADLARDMIQLSGCTEEDIAIEFTGLRPGEKLYEELLADGETTLPTPHPKLRVMKAEEAPGMNWLAELEAWLVVPVRCESDVKKDLRRWVPEYRPAWQ